MRSRVIKGDEAIHRLFSTLVAFFLLGLIFLFSSRVAFAGFFDVIGVNSRIENQKPRICIDKKDIIVAVGANSSAISPLDYRESPYAFAGEQIYFRLVVRDPDGSQDIQRVVLSLENEIGAVCSQIPLAFINGDCNGFDIFQYGYGFMQTDKAFECVLTVDKDWHGNKELKIVVYDPYFKPSDATYSEKWFFNPKISVNVTTSDGRPINFGKIPYGTGRSLKTAYSLNRLIVKNNAEGGARIWTFIAGKDFYQSSGSSLCSFGNILNMSNMEYRGWTSVNPRSWPLWASMSKFDENGGCFIPISGAGRCYGGKPVPYPKTMDAIPDYKEYLLPSQGKLEVEFRMTYPASCGGSFIQPQIMIFSRAV